MTAVQYMILTELNAGRDLAFATQRSINKADREGRIRQDNSTGAYVLTDQGRSILNRPYRRNADGSVWIEAR
jgi:hypothetical protein